MATWLDEATPHLDALQGATLTKLRELASSPPKGMDAIVAWRELEQRFSLARSLDPAETAKVFFGIDGGQRADVLSLVVREVCDAVDRALSDGFNDDLDPIVSERHLPAVIRLGGGPYSGHRAVRVNGAKKWGAPSVPPLAPDHLLRQLAPFFCLADGEPVVLLTVGGAAKRFIRLSQLRTVNAAAVDGQRHEAAEAERVRQREEAQRLEAAARLERQARELRGGPVGGGGWSST